MPVLGCSNHTAYVQSKCSGPRLCELTDAESIIYDRRLDDISEAEVEIPISGDTNNPCCSCLKDVEPWCHVLTIVREGDGVVWTGPILEVEYGFDRVVIKARDKVAWLQYRINEADIIQFQENTTQSLSKIALAIIALAMGDDGDSPCFMDCIQDLGDNALPGTDRSMTFQAYGGPTAYADFQLVAESGMNFTVVRDCLILSGEDISVAPIATLMDEHILGDLRIRKSGSLMANRVYVPWSNPIEGFEDDNWENCETCTEQGAVCPCPAVASVPTQCYGLVERMLDNTMGLPTLDAAQQVAQTYANAGGTAPRFIEFPSGTRLAPDTPWLINDMIPGQRVDVALSKFCIPIHQSFLLQRMSVRDTPEGEEISIDLGNIGILGNV